MTVVIGVECGGADEEREVLSSNGPMTLPSFVLAPSPGICAIIALCSQLQYPTKIVTRLVEKWPMLLPSSRE